MRGEKMSNKKIAVFFTGFIRNWKDNCESFKKYFVNTNCARYDIDVYVNSYLQTDRYYLSENQLLEVSKDEFKELDVAYDVKKAILFDYYKLKDHFYKKLKMLNLKNRAILESLFMQSYGIKNCAKMIDFNDYDYIVRTRFDVKFLGPCYIENVNKNRINMLPFFSNQGFVDHLIIGSSENMKKYIYSHDKLYDVSFCQRKKIYYVEDLYRENLIFNKVFFHYLPWKCSLSRRDGHLNLWSELIVNEEF
jgi:hypothetical protein